MKPSRAVPILSLVLLGFLSSCVYQQTVTFPDPNDVFITSGDGDIQKPYTPVGEFLYMEYGYRINFPVLGLIPVKDVDPDMVMREAVVREIRRMGGDGLINMRIAWEPPSGFLRNLIGLGSGGSVVITGTVIRR